MSKLEVRLVRCRACGMVYANPVAAELATGSFYDEKGESFYLSADKLEADYASVRFERELKIFRRFCKSGQVLDVGCSTGAFLFQLKERFAGDYAVTGTDVTSAAVCYAESRGISVVRESFLDLDEGKEAYDAITFWAVIEHLVEPRAFLEKAARMLRPGGHCFVLVPNLASLAVRVAGAKYRYIMPDHVNYFTPRTLVDFARRIPEMKVCFLTATHFNPVVILKDWRGGMERVPDAERAQLLKRTTAWKQNPLLKPLRWAYAGAEMILARAHLADNLCVVMEKTERTRNL